MNSDPQNRIPRNTAIQKQCLEASIASSPNNVFGHYSQRRPRPMNPTNNPALAKQAGLALMVGPPFAPGPRLGRGIFF